jgi:hypothetical protein
VACENQERGKVSAGLQSCGHAKGHTCGSKQAWAHGGSAKRCNVPHSGCWVLHRLDSQSPPGRWRFTGTKSVWSTLLEAMRTGLPQAEKTGFAIATLLAACAFACGIAVFGFYKLMQPVRNTNLGIAAYNPPPRTVINSPPAAQFTHNQRATSSLATDVPAIDTADVPAIDTAVETTGRAVQAEELAPKTVDPPPAMAPSSVLAEKPVVKRAVAARPHPTATREKARVAYPGYAAPM